MAAREIKINLMIEIEDLETRTNSVQARQINIIS